MLRCVVEQKDPDVFTSRVTQIKRILLTLMTVYCDKQSRAGDQRIQLLIRNLEFYNLPHRSDDKIYIFRFVHLLRRVRPGLEAPVFRATVNPRRESRALNEFV
jgi:hypothetical protein